MVDEGEDKKVRLGRYDSRAMDRIWTRMTRTRGCGRAGSSGKRTFHFRIEVARQGGSVVHYTHRLDARGREDLESTGGDAPLEFERGVEALKEAKPAEEWRAEAYHCELELPFEFVPDRLRARVGEAANEDAAAAKAAREEVEKVAAAAEVEARREVLERIALLFQRRGHAVTWAVHRSNEWGEDQPHAHLVIAAASDDAGGWRRPAEGGAEMKTLRAEIAGIVNQVAHDRSITMAAGWDGGGFKDVGVDRRPKKRMPMALKKAQQQQQAAGRPLSASRRRLAEAADRLDQAH
ncbi:MAG: hypothetical protein HQL31_06415, partial [Planctomycetes bacterium]|nr:hypothetical protein [Planctomycetota bacterium]